MLDIEIELTSHDGLHELLGVNTRMSRHTTVFITVVES